MLSRIQLVNIETLGCLPNREKCVFHFESVGTPPPLLIVSHWRKVASPRDPFPLSWDGGWDLHLELGLGILQSTLVPRRLHSFAVLH
ncbi:hypothetical protein CDAR_541801 [Caerostris darwini]|uniref:Uncharacterized protein n=1 Tax=Caerostris darwini TaxID=1538125 RepID=A0AAV4UUI4_9ARAC|nr:hypothetical protein CDAR_541801 [Caerostris darwini]